jgi:hypothetical protein
MYLLSSTNKNSKTNRGVKTSALCKQLLISLLSLLALAIAFTSSATNNKTSAVNNKTPILPISAYGDLPMVSNVQLSPDGNRIAMLKNVNGNQVLMAYNLVSGENQAIFQSDNLKIILNGYVWGNDDVLLINIGTVDAKGLKKHTNRLYKYDLNTDKKISLLVKPKESHKERLTQIQDQIVSIMPSEPDKILMAINFDHRDRFSLYEVNIRTKQRTRLRKFRGSIVDWFADQQGNPRIGTDIDEDVDDTKISYKLFSKEGKFERVLWSYELFEKTWYIFSALIKTPIFYLSERCIKANMRYLKSI